MEVVVAAIALVGALAALAAWFRPRINHSATPPALEPLHRDIAVLGERMLAVADRVTGVESAQVRVSDGIGRLDSGLASAGTLTASVREATEVIRAELLGARESLAQLQAGAQARRELEDQSARSLRRLEHVIAGTASKGAAGENIIDLVFSRLPIEWQVRDFRVGTRVVEFGLRLPNGLVLPIDSKWPATPALDALAAAEDPALRLRLKAQIEAAVMERAREVTRYLDPDRTAGFAIAVVPDAVDELSSAIKADCLRLNVVVISYAMFVPYLLLVFQTALRGSREIDVERLAAHLQTADQSLSALEDEIEGRLSRAITMLGNSRDDLRTYSSRARRSVSATQLRIPGLDTDDASITEPTGPVAEVPSLASALPLAGS